MLSDRPACSSRLCWPSCVDCGVGRLPLYGGVTSIWRQHPWRWSRAAEQTAVGVRYKEPKTGRARNVALSSTVVEELKTWRALQAQEFLRLGSRPDKDTFVVTRADGGPLQPRSLTHEWVRVLGNTELPRIRFHDLRHAHGTHMLASGIHPKVASERLGHSKVGITLDLYSHVMPGMQEDAVAKIEAAFKAAQRRP